MKTQSIIATGLIALTLGFGTTAFAANKPGTAPRTAQAASAQKQPAKEGVKAKKSVKKRMRRHVAKATAMKGTST